MTKESASELKQLYTNVMQIYRTLETLQRPVDKWDDFLVFITVQRLDCESVKAWQNKLGSSKELPSWTQLSDFLITRLISQQAFENSRTGKNPKQQTALKANFQGQPKDANSATSFSCIIRSSKHFVSACPQYTGKTIQQRLSIITKNKLCYNCLGPHRVPCCKNTKRSHKCGKKHHTNIHQNNVKMTESLKSETATTDNTAKNEIKSKEDETKVLHSTFSRNPPAYRVLLATAQVEIISPKIQPRSEC